MKTSILLSFSALLLVATTVEAQLVKKTQLYVGRAASNNGTVTTFPAHLGGKTDKIGFSIDDASAIPEVDYVRIYTGTGRRNNEVVSSNSDHLSDSTKPIGFLSRKPIAGGTLIYQGNVPGCNEGEASDNINHKACTTKVLGYALPQSAQ